MTKEQELDTIISIRKNHIPVKALEGFNFFVEQLKLKNWTIEKKMVLMLQNLIYDIEAENNNQNN